MSTVPKRHRADRDVRLRTVPDEMKIAIKSVAAYAILAASLTVFAQQNGPAAAHNVVQLSATGSVEVVQDLLSITLGTSRDGADAAQVQTQLRTALEAALSEARKVVHAGQLEVRTGNFGLAPRYGRDGKALGWQGSTELVIEGRDFASVSALAGRLTTLNVTGVSFGLSREQRLKVEAEAQSMAIERFKARSQDIARGFGFAGYTLREVSVSGSDHGAVPRVRMMAMEARAGAAEAPLPVEAGKATVTVTVSGSVQLK